MKYELTTEQTQFIAGYSYSVGIKYYDVELEIVDHIAQWVENEMNTNHSTFDEAYEKMKEEFPKEDLLKIVKEKKKYIERKVSRMIEKEFISFFTLPKLSLTAMLLVFAITFPYLNSIFQIISGTVIALLVVYHANFISGPIHKEIQAIGEMKRCELLSVKVKSRYERILQIFFIACNGLNIARLFMTDNRPHINIHDPATKIIALQSVLVFSVLIGVLLVSANTVRRNVLNKIVNDYPYAFTE